MIEKGFPLQLVSIFESWFGSLRSSVLWNNMSSSLFDIKFGVLLGSLQGTKFCNLIMDKLSKLLHDSGLGCHVGGFFVGVVAFADDIILLPASCVKLQQIYSYESPLV